MIQSYKKYCIEIKKQYHLIKNGINFKIINKINYKIKKNKFYKKLLNKKKKNKNLLNLKNHKKYNFCKKDLNINKKMNKCIIF